MNPNPLPARVWPVGALCRAIADALEARFNPVTVTGEISGFTRAASGHCYFSLKDATGQLRCAMFRRAATLSGMTPREGEQVEVRGRLGVYEPRGDLQLIVESMTRAGQGALFEQFLLLKAKLEGEGLFAPDRKRPLPPMPRAIGLVTSLGAAALHDVVTALQRRLPHIPVILAPAAVQGASAPQEIVQALGALQELNAPVDVILLVRGGGSIEDLWSFNDERVARAIVGCRVPVVSGVGHETDFTIADFCADLRAPTPTAAAELVAEPRTVWLGALDLLGERMDSAVTRVIDTENQRLDGLASYLGRPSQRIARQHLRLAAAGQRHAYAVRSMLTSCKHQLQAQQALLAPAASRRVERASQQLQRLEASLRAMDPRLVLGRGYAWLNDSSGTTITSVTQMQPGQQVRATLADGEVDLSVSGRTPG